MKKLLVFTLLIALFSVFSVAASAETDPPRLADNADLLTPDEEAEIIERLDEVSEKWEYDVVIITVDEIGVWSADIYAEQYFYEGGYGFGDDDSGVALLISIGERDWGIYGTGMTDSDAEAIGDSLLNDLGDDDFHSAFLTFADEIDRYHSFPFLRNLVITVVIGLVVALIVTSSMRSKLKSIVRSDYAREYVRSGSFKLNQSRDLFLYSTVSRVRKPKNNSSGSRGGGRSGGGGRASGKF